MITVVLSLALSASSQTQRKRMSVIEPGQFHGDEISAKSDQRWLGLFLTKDSSALRYSRLRVRHVTDDVMDHGTQKKTGKQVSVDSPREPLFLVRGAEMLHPGPVITIFSEKHNFERSLEKVPLTMKLGSASYVLKVMSPDKHAELCRENVFPRNAQLVLGSGTSSQVLYTLDACGNEPYWYLLWAGDLDRDGKLDLYVSVTQHYDVAQRKLFLSSQARRGKLVREVASFETGGC